VQMALWLKKRAPFATAIAIVRHQEIILSKRDVFFSWWIIKKTYLNVTKHNDKIEQQVIRTSGRLSKRTKEKNHWHYQI
jgi:hypothetical protein